MLFSFRKDEWPRAAQPGLRRTAAATHIAQETQKSEDAMNADPPRTVG
jgi:hypothetical protein